MTDYLKDLRSHKWVGRRQGGDPADAGSYEWVRYCSVCGMEDTCEDPLPPCPGEDGELEGESDKQGEA